MIQERIITPYLRDNIGWTAFHYLARHGMHSQLKKLHDVAIAAADGSEAKARELINATDGYGDSPLSDAAYWDKYETTELLLNLGANPNVVNKLGQTPAHRAIISNLDNPSLKVAKLLIDRTDIRHMRDMPSQLELHEGKHIREIIEYITRKSVHAPFFTPVEETNADLDDSTSPKESCQNENTNVQSEERTHSSKRERFSFLPLSSLRPSLVRSSTWEQKSFVLSQRLLQNKALKGHASGPTPRGKQPPSSPRTRASTSRLKRTLTKARSVKKVYKAKGCNTVLQGENQSVTIFRTKIINLRLDSDKETLKQR